MAFDSFVAPLVEAGSPPEIDLRTVPLHAKFYGIHWYVFFDGYFILDRQKKCCFKTGATAELIELYSETNFQILGIEQHELAKMLGKNLPHFERETGGVF